MNIIINSKYASVYAAVHSSVWEAVSRRRPASDISCKRLLSFDPTGGDQSSATGSCGSSVVQDISHSTVHLLYINVV